MPELAQLVLACLIAQFFWDLAMCVVLALVSLYLLVFNFPSWALGPRRGLSVYEEE